MVRSILILCLFWSVRSFATDTLIEGLKVLSQQQQRDMIIAFLNPATPDPNVFASLIRWSAITEDSYQRDRIELQIKFHRQHSPDLMKHASIKEALRDESAKPVEPPAPAKPVVVVTQQDSVVTVTPPKKPVEVPPTPVKPEVTEVTPATVESKNEEFVPDILLKEHYIGAEAAQQVDLEQQTRLEADKRDVGESPSVELEETMRRRIAANRVRREEEQRRFDTVLRALRDPQRGAEVARVLQSNDSPKQLLNL